MNYIADHTLLDTPIAAGVTLRQHLTALVQGLTAADVDKDTDADIIMEWATALPVVGNDLPVVGGIEDNFRLFLAMLKAKSVRSGERTGTLPLATYHEIVKLRRQWELEVAARRPASTPHVAGELE